MLARSAPRAAARAVPRLVRPEARAPPSHRAYTKLASPAPRRPTAAPQWRFSPAVRQLLTQQKRNASTTSRVKDFFVRETRKAPFAFPVTFAGVSALILWLLYYIPVYNRDVIVKPFEKFPESVANKLRRGMFYTREPNVDLRESMRYFRDAFILMRREGMDMWSDEVVNMRYQLALIHEKSNHYKGAIKALEILRVDCQEWLDNEGEKHRRDGNRARILKHTINARVKLGQLYSCKYVKEVKEAEKHLGWAVETMLREMHHREAEGVAAAEGHFMDGSEVGATLEALGTHYETYDQHHLALPLFLKALEFLPQESCHSVVLMNNIASCLVQQRLPPSPPPSAPSTPASKPPSEAPSPSSSLSPARAPLVAHAREWANKALARAKTIPTQDEECSMGCAAATHNLGEFAEMEGKFKEALEFYDQAGRLAWWAGFKEGRVNAKAAVKRVQEKM